MGGKLSRVQEQHIQELEKLADSVKSVGIKIHRKDIRKLLIYLWQQFPSYPEAGRLQVSRWKKIGKAMHQAPRAPAEQLVAWRKLMEILITHENPMELTSLIGKSYPIFSSKGQHKLFQIKSGQFTAVDQQKDLPDEAYPIIILAVFVALSKVEGKEGGKSFANIKQQNGKNYGTFIDRLKLAIERHINNPQAQEELLLKLAVENANVDCKQLLTPLVASGSALDLAQLLEAAVKAGSNVYNMEYTQNAAGVQKSLKKPALQKRLYQDINMSEDVYVEPRKALQVSEEEDRRSTVVLEENEEYLDLTVLQ
ncbi:hypothetical protein E2320_008630 [Naja naja]|nr:hypothetical protein E2320_008630 [Naja naja]